MFLLILGSVLVVAGLIYLMLATTLRSSRLLAVFPIAVGVSIIFTSCLTIIEAKNVGVLTTFGRPSDRTLEPGLHLKAPWQKVTELDGTIQTDEYRGKDCIYAQIGDGTTACVSATNRWSIVPDKGNEIYGSYRSDDVNAEVRTALASTVFKASVAKVIGEYDPTAGIRFSSDGASPDFAPNYDQLAADITESFEQRVGDSGGYIQSHGITVSFLNLSDVTKRKIADFQAEVANTQVALQRKATADAQAEANRALSSSVSNDPNVLVSRCLDLLGQMVEEKAAVPAGFSCWPGGGSALVLPSGR